MSVVKCNPGLCIVKYATVWCAPDGEAGQNSKAIRGGLCYDVETIGLRRAV